MSNKNRNVLIVYCISIFKLSVGFCTVSSWHYLDKLDICTLSRLFSSLCFTTQHANYVHERMCPLKLLHHVAVQTYKALTINSGNFVTERKWPYSHIFGSPQKPFNMIYASF